MSIENARPIDVVFDSNNATFGGKDTPFFQMEPELRNVVTYAVLWTNIPFAYYVIDRYNNTFLMRVVTYRPQDIFDGRSTFSGFMNEYEVLVYIKPGTYTVDTLGQEVKRAIATINCRRRDIEVPADMSTIDRSTVGGDGNRFFTDIAGPGSTTFDGNIQESPDNRATVVGPNADQWQQLDQALPFADTFVTTVDKHNGRLLIYNQYISPVVNVNNNTLNAVDPIVVASAVSFDITYTIPGNIPSFVQYRVQLPSGLYKDQRAFIDAFTYLISTDGGSNFSVFDNSQLIIFWRLELVQLRMFFVPTSGSGTWRIKQTSGLTNLLKFSGGRTVDSVYNYPSLALVDSVLFAPFVLTYRPTKTLEWFSLQIHPRNKELGEILGISKPGVWYETLGRQLWQDGGIVESVDSRPYGAQKDEDERLRNPGEDRPSDTNLSDLAQRQAEWDKLNTRQRKPDDQNRIQFLFGDKIVNLLGSSRLDVHCDWSGSQGLFRTHKKDNQLLISVPVMSNFGTFLLYQPTIADVPISKTTVNNMEFYLTMNDKEFYAKNSRDALQPLSTVEKVPYLPLNGEGFQICIRFYCQDGVVEHGVQASNATARSFQ